MSIGSMIAKCSQTVQFKTVTRTASATGARTHTSANKGISVQCWLQPASLTVRELYGARDVRVTHRLYVESNPGVGEGGVCEINDTTYLVKGVIDQAGLGTLYCVDVEEQR